MDIDTETDGGSFIADQLDKRRQVTVGRNGWIMDIWDPETKKTYDEEGNETGTRDRPFHPPEISKVRETGYITYNEAEGEIPSYLDMTGDGLGLFSNKTFEQLGNDAEITIDPKGNVIEVRDPKTNKLYKEEGGKLVEFGTREMTFPVYVAKKEVRSPAFVTYVHRNHDEVQPGSDLWEALTRSPDMQVTLNSQGFIIDIWDSKTHIRFNIHGGILSMRADPFPSDTNIASIKAKYEALQREIHALRKAWRMQSGSTREVSSVKIKTMRREYGQLVWLYGRLVGRKRRRDRRYLRKKTKSTTPQK